ncbi:MAG: NAD(P)H-binding protein [Rhodoferax sp.]|nr:NAD(P)H-binding protein [Rhodoferax sp.]
MSRILVVGASGTVGSELVRLLQARGHAVAEATSRAPTRSGQVALDVVAGTGVDAAFAGVERAFLLAPPGYTNQDELLRPLIDAARRSGLRRVVLMTAMGADADEAAPLRKAERHLEQSGVPFNILRPNWFMQNFNTFWLHGILNGGTIALPVGQARGSFIDARDIAATAAALLSGDGLANQAFDLTGAQALDHDQVAAILSRVTGRAIRFQDIAPDAMRAGLVGAGVPPNYADFLVMILGYFKAGYSERTTDAVQQITGAAPRSFEAYAADYRSSWLV